MWAVSRIVRTEHERVRQEAPACSHDFASSGASVLDLDDDALGVGGRRHRRVVRRRARREARSVCVGEPRGAQRDGCSRLSGGGCAASRPHGDRSRRHAPPCDVILPLLGFIVRPASLRVHLLPLLDFNIRNPRVLPSPFNKPKIRLQLSVLIGFSFFCPFVWHRCSPARLCK